MEGLFSEPGLGEELMDYIDQEEMEEKAPDDEFEESELPERETEEETNADEEEREEIPAPDEDFILSTQKELKEIASRYPECEITSLGDIMEKEKGREIIDLWKKGVSLKEACAVAYLDQIVEKRTATAVQKEKNRQRSRAHMQPVKGEMAERYQMPQEILEQYRAFFPEWSENKMMQDYKKRSR